MKQPLYRILVWVEPPIILFYMAFCMVVFGAQLLALSLLTYPFRWTRNWVLDEGRGTKFLVELW